MRLRTRSPIQSPAPGCHLGRVSCSQLAPFLVIVPAVSQSSVLECVTPSPGASLLTSSFLQDHSLFRCVIHTLSTFPLLFLEFYFFYK